MTARYTLALTIRGEDLFADASGMTQGDNPDSDREWFALRKYVAALETENAALRGDTARLLDGLSWAMDIMDMYDARLAEFDGAERVYSPVHLEGKANVRAAMDAAMQGEK